jgi:VCBS repeat-containing protein
VLASGALLTLNGDGSYDYDPNDQFDNLGAGQSATDTFDTRCSTATAGMTRQR